MKKLNLGHGNDIRKGFINVDYPDVDLNKRLPYKDKEFDFVLCRSVLYYIKDLKNAVSECKRISKNLVCNLPHFSGNPPDRIYWGKVEQERFAATHLFANFNPDYIIIETFIPKIKLRFNKRSISLKIWEFFFPFILRARTMWMCWGDHFET